MLCVLVGSCGGSPAGSGQPILTLVADDLRFDPTRLEVAANTPFEIVLFNRERGIPHNVSVYADAAATDALAVGEISIGEARTTTRVPALDSGTYLFRCDVHRLDMTGTLEVR